MNPESNRVNTADFLISAASLLPSHHYAHKLLKSYYLTKSRKITQADRQQGSNFFSIENCCPKCSTTWDDGEFSLNILPIKLTKRRRQNLISKLTNDGKAKKGTNMKIISKKTNNITTITCKICKNRNKVALWKKTQTDAKETESNPKQIISNIADVPINEKKSNVPSQQSHSQQSPINKAQKLTPKPNKPNQLLSVSQNKKKNKNKTLTQNKTLSKGIGKKGAPPPSQTKSSTSMKKNSLLQLAAALKSKTKISDPNSKLKQMFSN